MLEPWYIASFLKQSTYFILVWYLTDCNLIDRGDALDFLCLVIDDSLFHF